MALALLSYLMPSGFRGPQGSGATRDSRVDERWSKKKTLLFVVVTCAILWAMLIALAYWFV